MIGVVDERPASAARLDPESAEWLGALAGTRPPREAALTRLHEMLVRIAWAECRRRGPRLQITGPELDDLACQTAADAVMAITRKLGQFRGESRSHGPVGAGVAAWPAISLVGSYELLVWLIRTAGALEPGPAEQHVSDSTADWCSGMSAPDPGH